MRELLEIIDRMDFSGLDYWNQTPEEQRILIKHVYNVIDKVAFDNGIPQLSKQYEELWREAHYLAIDNEQYELADSIYTAIYALGMTISDKKETRVR